MRTLPRRGAYLSSQNLTLVKLRQTMITRVFGLEDKWLMVKYKKLDVNKDLKFVTFPTFQKADFMVILERPMNSSARPCSSKLTGWSGGCGSLITQ